MELPIYQAAVRETRLEPKEGKPDEPYEIVGPQPVVTVADLYAYLTDASATERLFELPSLLEPHLPD